MMYSRRKTREFSPWISSQNTNQFTANDHNLAIAIARQLGSSVEKVLLYEEMAQAYENLRSAQEQVLQSEKMSAVGQLISGVAHELNNPLTAILGYVQLNQSRYEISVRRILCASSSSRPSALIVWCRICSPFSVSVSRFIQSAPPTGRRVWRFAN